MELLVEEEKMPHTDGNELSKSVSVGLLESSEEDIKEEKEELKVTGKARLKSIMKSAKTKAFSTMNDIYDS